jgi:hypothetical protein
MLLPEYSKTMEIQIDSVVKANYLDPFGIKVSDAEFAAKEHDFKKVMRIKDGPTIILFMKKMNGHHLLIKGVWNEPMFGIEDIFEVYDDLIDNIDIKEKVNLLSVMQKIAESFGYDIILGDRIEKYVIDDRIRIPKLSNPNEFMNKIIGNYIKIPEMFERRPSPEGFNMKGLVDTKFMLEQGIGSDFLNVAFLYAIDPVKYKVDEMTHRDLLRNIFPFFCFDVFLSLLDHNIHTYVYTISLSPPRCFRP